MRTTWRGLTARGKVFLLTGVAIAVAAALLGQRDLLRVAALLVALPLVAAFVLARRDDRLTVSRSLDPPHVTVGGTATVRLRLRNAGERRTGPLLVTDRLDPALGVEPRFVLERLDAGDDAATEYRVDALARGRHVLGPLELTLEDPFGLVRTSRTTATTNTLTVVPVVAALEGGPVLAGLAGSGDGSGRRTAAAGHDDIGTRAYRAGDERRRVHWRATARTGELMVRQEEQPWEAHALVVLDTRLVAHSRPAPGVTADLDTSSFEWAVHAAASIGSRLARSERRVRLVAGRTDLLASGGTTGALLDALALVRTRDQGGVVPDTARGATAPVVVVVLGAYDAADLRMVTALRSTATAGVAIVLDTGTWTAREGEAARREQLAAPLRAAGWRVAVAGRGDAMQDVWARAR